MTYAQYGNIEATDYNTLVGSNPNTTSGILNTVWSTGGTTTGYGQTAVASVTAGNTVTAAQWAALVNNTANSASHQGSTITSVTAPVAGGTITYLSAIPTNLTTIYNNRLNAATQGSTTSNAAVYSSTWSTGLTFTHVVTFSSGDAARYFFNAGGQLKITCTHANNSAGINLLLNNLVSNIGTVALSAPSTGSVTIASTSYNGVTKIGGGGTAPTILANSGYFALGTANANIFTQTASTGPAGYLGTFIRMIAKTNGTQGTNGDKGSIITIYTVWDEVPNGLVAGANSTTTVTIVPPESTYLPTASWGTPTVTGTAALI
jgi:hypothetical protein